MTVTQAGEECILDLVKWFDSATKTWGYSIECVAKAHNNLAFGECPGEVNLTK